MTLKVNSLNLILLPDNYHPVYNESSILQICIKQFRGHSEITQQISAYQT